jgi:hypothetical protein
LQTCIGRTVATGPKGGLPFLDWVILRIASAPHRKTSPNRC